MRKADCLKGIENVILKSVLKVKMVLNEPIRLKAEGEGWFEKEMTFIN